MHKLKQLYKHHKDKEYNIQKKKKIYIITKAQIIKISIK